MSLPLAAALQAGRFIHQGTPAQCMHREQIAKLYALPPERLDQTVHAQQWARQLD